MQPGLLNDNTRRVKVKFVGEEIHNSIGELEGGIKALGDKGAKFEEDCALLLQKPGDWVIEITKSGDEVRRFDLNAVMPNIISINELYEKHSNISSDEFEKYIDSLKSLLKQGEKLIFLDPIEGSFDMKDINKDKVINSIGELEAFVFLLLSKK